MVRDEKNQTLARKMESAMTFSSLWLRKGDCDFPTLARQFSTNWMIIVLLEGSVFVLFLL